MRVFHGHTEHVNSVAFSLDGSRVLTGSGDKTARLWDISTGAALRTFTGQEGSVYMAGLSPDGTRILTGSGDNTARLWDASTGEVLRTFTSYSSAVSSVAFSPDGIHLATGSWDGTVRLWPYGIGGELPRSRPLGGFLNPKGREIPANRQPRASAHHAHKTRHSKASDRNYRGCDGIKSRIPIRRHMT